MFRLILIVLSVLLTGSTVMGVNIPRDQALFDATAIEVAGPSARQFVYGDNIAGYYEGYTHAYKRGVGYMMKNSPIYMDFASFNGINLNNKKKGVKTLIYPYGVRTVYDNGFYDEFALFSRSYGASVQVSGDGKSTLAIFPILALMTSKSYIKKETDAVVMGPQKAPAANNPAPSYIAFAADVPFDFKDEALAEYTEISNTVKPAASVVKPLFVTKKPAGVFTLYMAFGFNEKEALDKVRGFAKNNALKAHKKQVGDFLTRSILWSDDPSYNKALAWSKVSAYSMVVDEFGRGIWAGLPWFRDNWGRDTFISLPGTLLVTGMFEDAKAVMTNFSTYQNLGSLRLEVSIADTNMESAVKDYIKSNISKKISFKNGKIVASLDPKYIRDRKALAGMISSLEKVFTGVKAVDVLEYNKDYGRIPNRVNNDSVIYNTTDGTPWFIREMYEYLSYTGDTAFAREIYPVVKVALNGSISNYADELGFLTHDDADTWMDARINGGLPWSARGNRANDIQVLWYNALRVGAWMALQNNEKEQSAAWSAMADKLKDNFIKLFWDGRSFLMADRVRKDNTADYKPRPNQLMLISVPQFGAFIPEDVGAWVVKKSVSELLYPYGIASLSQNHPYFHPYHDGNANYHKDAAYHNGTIWGWNAGPAVTAMARFGYQDLAWALTTNLAWQILEVGCLGTMSENLDAMPDKKGGVKPTGTYSQAWSVAEFARNGFQDFGGFMPDLLNGRIVLAPSVPAAWKSYAAQYAFGKDGVLTVNYEKKGDLESTVISYKGYGKSLKLVYQPVADTVRYSLDIPLVSGKAVTVSVNSRTGTFTLSGKAVKPVIVQKSYKDIIGDLKFQTPQLLDSVQSVKEKDFLKKIVEGKKFE